MLMASPRSSIGVDAAYQYVSSGTQMFSGMLFYFIILRLFDTTTVGAIALFLAIIVLFNIVFTFGLNIAAQHFIAFSIANNNHAESRKIIFKLLKISIFFSALGFFSLLVLSPFISYIFLHNYSYIFLIRLLSIDLVGTVLFSILNGILLGTQRFRLSASINIGVWISYYFGSLIPVFFLRSVELIIAGWIIGMFSGVFVISFVIFRTIPRCSEAAKAPNNKILFAFSIPILFSSIITYGATYADRFIVAGLMSLTSLGIYNLSLLIVTGLSFLSLPFNNILMPKFSELFAKNKKTEISMIIRASSLLLSAIYVPAALGIATLAPLLIDLFGGKSYLSGSLPLIIMMFFSAMFVIRNILIQALASLRKTVIFLYSSGFAFSINIILSLITIPRFGIVGAAVGFSSVYAVTFAVLSFFSSRERILSVNVKGLVKIWLASGLMIVCIYILENFIGKSPIFLPFYIVVGGILYIYLSKSIGILDEHSKSLLNSIFPDKSNWFTKMVHLFIG